MTQADLDNQTLPETDFHTDDYRSKITTITTKKDNIVPATAVESWDISEAVDGSVMAYVEKTDEVLEPIPPGAIPTNAKIYSNDDRVKEISKTIYATPLSETNTTYAYKLTIGGKGGIIANENMMNYFAGFFLKFYNDGTIDLSALDTSEVTNMKSMFFLCNKLTSLDVSKFDTSNVTNMASMFEGCSLTNLDISSFDTSKVTDMSSMFYGCNSLTSLDVSSFDTSKVTDMWNMFNGCSSLTSLDVSKFDTSQVANMFAMFEGCSRLTSLDVSKFDTSNVTNMGSMFYNCSSLTNLDLRSFNTSKVTTIGHMFYGCSKLIQITVSNKWVIGSSTDASTMFYYCGTDHVTVV